MAWINSIDEAHADGALAAFYADLRARRGQSTPIIEAQGLDVEALQQHLALYSHLMFAPGGVPRDEREIIAVVVSAANGCGYCVREHLGRLQYYIEEDDALQAVRAAPETIADARQRAIALYARKLTLQPHALRAGDIAALRAQGLDDADILRVNLITAYFNFVNRIAQGLGVDADAP
ncbi:MAG: peroxidase-related enzyme [Pseudomonadota bacterium]|nr:peroxidase-related enzyme [Pseudomonadota bacterium]MDE3142387.1 peroxidase-related enzyme [Pseudomonadota bacterium]